MNTTVLILAMYKLLYGRPHRVNTNITKCITSIRSQKKKTTSCHNAFNNGTS